MTIFKYNFKKINNKKREQELNALEKKLKKKGWTSLDWYPQSVDTAKYTNVKWNLMGCPPNYSGPYCDHKEIVARTLHVPRDVHEDQDKILIRNILYKGFNCDRDTWGRDELRIYD